MQRYSYCQQCGCSTVDITQVLMLQLYQWYQWLRILVFCWWIGLVLHSLLGCRHGVSIGGNVTRWRWNGQGRNWYVPIWIHWRWYVFVDNPISASFRYRGSQCSWFLRYILSWLLSGDGQGLRMKLCRYQNRLQREWMMCLVSCVGTVLTYMFCCNHMLIGVVWVICLQWCWIVGVRKSHLLSLSLRTHCDW